MIPKISIKHRPFVLVGIPLLTFILGFIIASTLPTKPVNLIESRFSPVKNSFTNPLLDCDLADFSSSQNLDKLKSIVQKQIDIIENKSEASFVSVYIRNLNNGPWMGVDEKEYFSPASLIKVPLMITYYKLAETDPTILLKKIKHIGNTSPYNQDITPQVTLTLNQEYTVDELIDHMITYSDNQSFDLLVANTDPQNIFKTYSDLGVDISKSIRDPAGDILTVRDYASFFRVLFNSSYLSRTMSEKALNLLSQVKFDQGLRAGVPVNITVSHKFGERSFTSTGQRQLHDCGIIYYPNHPYLVCIMTRGKDFNSLASAIKQITQATSDYLLGQN